MERVARIRLGLFVLAILAHRASSLWELEVPQDDTQPLSKIALHRSTQKLDKSITISANPVLLGQKVSSLAYISPKVFQVVGAVGTGERYNWSLYRLMYKEPFCIDRGKQQNMLLSSTRSPLVQTKQTGLEYSHLQNSSMFLSLFGLSMYFSDCIPSMIMFSERRRISALRYESSH
jgi:hypothetical protein